MPASVTIFHGIPRVVKTGEPLKTHRGCETASPHCCGCGARNTAGGVPRKRILLEAVEQHPSCALMHCNLACYDSVLGELEVAKARLQLALKLDRGMRLMALDDEDLRPLRDEIG